VKGPAPLRQLFDDLRDALEGLGVPYAVMGGIAASAWGLPRFTHDIDVAVNLRASEIGRLLGALEKRGYLVPEEFRRGWTDQLAGTRKIAVKRVAGKHVWDIDFFLAESDFLRSALARRKLVDLDGRQTPLITPEDLIVLKLVAWRPKDQGDIDDLLLVVGALDEAYLHEWAERLNIRERLGEAWRRAGRAPKG
jgi:predicted nucleotidyltransferase